jgi:hypothetical protein
VRANKYGNKQARVGSGAHERASASVLRRQDDQRAIRHAFFNAAHGGSG